MNIPLHRVAFRVPVDGETSADDANSIVHLDTERNVIVATRRNPTGTRPATTHIPMGNVAWFWELPAPDKNLALVSVSKKKNKKLTPGKT